MSKLVAKKTLFQLLTDDTSSEINHVYVSKEDYLKSIIIDISQLLNTRCIFPKKFWKTHLPLNYGLPYLWGMHEPDDLMHPDKQDTWKAALVKTLRYFEPRLKRPKINIVNVNVKTQTLEVEISGEVIIQKLPHKISFPLNVSNIYAA